jgi:uncharacterized membrane protein YsdA (DUF1294 family)
MPSGLLKITLGYLVFINLLTMLISWRDKRASIKKKQRTPESTLLMLSALGGSVGMLLSMKLFRHKTRKYKFNIGVPVILALQLLAIFYLIYLAR